MKFPGTKNKIVIPLIIITTLIWGMIIYRIIDYFNSLGDKEEIVETDAKEPAYDQMIPALGIKGQFSFETLVHDPFSFSRKKKKEVQLPPVQQIFLDGKTFKPVYQYKISGVIISGENKLCVFEENDSNQSYFLQEGESHNGIIIKYIGTDKVTIIEDGKRKEIPVNK